METLALTRQPTLDGLTIFALEKPRKEMSYQELKERYYRLIQKRRNQSLALKRLGRAHERVRQDNDRLRDLIVKIRAEYARKV